MPLSSTVLASTPTLGRFRDVNFGLGRCKPAMSRTKAQNTFEFFHQDPLVRHHDSKKPKRALFISPIYQKNDSWIERERRTEKTLFTARGQKTLLRLLFCVQKSENPKVPSLQKFPMKSLPFLQRLVFDCTGSEVRTFSRKCRF